MRSRRLPLIVGLGTFVLVQIVLMALFGVSTKTCVSQTTPPLQQCWMNTGSIIVLATLASGIAILTGVTANSLVGSHSTVTQQERDEAPSIGERYPALATLRERYPALATLRERYARGELSNEQFEWKLDRLLETNTPERAAEWRREKS